MNLWQGTSAIDTCRSQKPNTKIIKGNTVLLKKSPKATEQYRTSALNQKTQKQKSEQSKQS